MLNILKMTILKNFFFFFFINGNQHKYLLLWPSGTKIINVVRTKLLYYLKSGSPTSVLTENHQTQLKLNLFYFRTQLVCTEQATTATQGVQKLASPVQFVIATGEKTRDERPDSDYIRLHYIVNCIYTYIQYRNPLSRHRAYQRDRKSRRRRYVRAE